MKNNGVAEAQCFVTSYVQLTISTAHSYCNLQLMLSAHLSITSVQLTFVTGKCLDRCRAFSLVCHHTSDISMLHRYCIVIGQIIPRTWLFTKSVGLCAFKNVFFYRKIKVCESLSVTQQEKTCESGNSPYNMTVVFLFYKLDTLVSHLWYIQNRPVTHWLGSMALRYTFSWLGITSVEDPLN